jgi:endonuclease/exonuclease/phosphatase family metal-dependent hydrolase
MTQPVTRLRVATYNIHKCRGLDRRTRPDRIAAVLHELNADILALQEVVNAPGGAAHNDQAHELAAALGDFGWSFGANRPLEGGTYGNLTLTRLPLLRSRNHDLSNAGRERRGVLQTDLNAGGGRVLHLFNAHLGTSIRERRQQGQKLLGEEILTQSGLNGPRIVLGDFNDWHQGLTTRLLRQSFESFHPRHAFRMRATFPGMMPFVTLDHCYYEPPLKLVETKLWRSPRALVASDHLPLIAEFEWVWQPPGA